MGEGVRSIVPEEKQKYHIFRFPKSRFRLGEALPEYTVEKNRWGMQNPFRMMGPLGEQCNMEGNEAEWYGNSPTLDSRKRIQQVELSP